MEKSRWLPGLALLLILCIFLLPGMHTEAATAISSASLTIKAPAAADEPDYEPVLPSGAKYYLADYTNEYYYHDVVWTDITNGANRSLKVGEAYFERGHKYKATIYLTAYSGYEFTSSTTCTINGAAASSCSVTNSGQLRVEIEFPAAKETIYDVNLTITAPADGAAPDYYPDFLAGYGYYSAAYSTSTFLNDVIWQDLTMNSYMRVGEDRFQGHHVYKVFIYLTASEDYVFSDSVYCRLNGKVINTCQVTTQGQLCVTYEFPSLIKRIDTVKVEITPPVDGERPDYYPRLIDAEGYYSLETYDENNINDVYWYDMSTNETLYIMDKPVFEGGVIYKVDFFLTPRDGYEFAETINILLNGEPVQKYKVLMNKQLKIEYEFPPAAFLIDAPSVTLAEPKEGDEPEQYPKVPSDAHYTAYCEWIETEIGHEGYFNYFVIGRTYYANVYLIPDEGYVFSEAACSNVTCNRKHPADAEINGSGELVFRYDFGTLTTAGWHKNAKGWWYRRSDGTYPKNQWEMIGGKWYHFDADGYMQTNWLKLNGTWYYLGSSGAMVTGWNQVGGKWYYFSSSGAMQVGWKKLGGVWYYLDSTGAMVTGWKTIEGKTYYFKENGAMAAKEWCKGWWLNADGTWTYKYKASWKKNSKGWWYGDTSGWYAKNCTIKIDGKNYTFDANGYMK
ncbi:MAG: N-acetylmuramoyl-L-alanine amidase family protein [Lachnospiraceae bacterium]|nr:N-acetylmuramoyl-L-alanine amidase family protein [Lachnospiraceae bacterium]